MRKNMIVKEWKKRDSNRRDADREENLPRRFFLKLVISFSDFIFGKAKLN